MSDKGNQHRDDGEARRYFYIMPNLTDDSGLSLAEFRLLAHYIRRGTCWESIRTTSEICGMRTNTVTAARNSLVEKGWLVVERRMNNGAVVGLTITVVDRWQLNMQAYGVSQKGIQGVSKELNKEEPIKKNPKNKGKVADATSSPSQLRGAVLESLRSNKVGMTVAFLVDYKRELFEHSSTEDGKWAANAWFIAGKTKAAAVMVVTALGHVHSQNAEPNNAWTWAIKEISDAKQELADLASRTIAREDE